MMTREEVQAIVIRLTMPNWLFVKWDVFLRPKNHVYLVAEMLVPERSTGEFQNVNYHRTFECRSVEYVLEEARKLLYYMAMHEVNEHLHLDGKQWVDMHEEGDPMDYEEMMEERSQKNGG